jgi:hypothetical protein
MSDLDLVLDWSAKDEQFVDRIAGTLDEDRATVFKAIVETRGDLDALSRRVAPELLERLRARLPERGGKSVDYFGTPLVKAWAAPQDLAPQQIAQHFLERYGARLDELTGAASKVAAAAKGAAAASKAVSTARDLHDAVSQLEKQLADVERAVKGCAHPEGKSGDWSERGLSLAKECKETIEAARQLEILATGVKARCEAVAGAFEEWDAASDAERASTAGSMAVRVKAAAEAVVEMREQIAQIAV